MNSERVAKMKGKRVRIRPMPRRFEPSGQELAAMDDWWQIGEASKSQIRLANPRTDHFFTLGTDHIREFLTDHEGRSDGFLVLKSQIIMKAAGVYVEPLLARLDAADKYAAARPRQPGND